MTKQLLSDIADEARFFIDSIKSLQLATSDNAGTPLASYAPFIRDENGVVYILVSTLAQHTENLMDNEASILIIEDEAACHQIYARKRIQFQCDCLEIDREDVEFKNCTEALKSRHGDVIDTLVGLSDFKLVQLQPKNGRFIKGFGQAYEIDAALNVLRPVQPGS